MSLAVILAGGLGTRVQSVLGGIPKPMCPVLGKPWLEWEIEFLVQQNVRKIIVSTGYKAEVIERHVESCCHPNAVVSVAREMEPLGTAGGFLNAVRSLPKTNRLPRLWLVLNGDSLAAVSLSVLLNSLDRSAEDAAKMAISVNDTSRYGSLACDDKGYIREFMEKRNGSGLINTGIYLLRHSLIGSFPNQFPLSFERIVFPELLQLGKRLVAFPAEVLFLEIGTPETLKLANKFIRAHHHLFGRIPVNA